MTKRPRGYWLDVENRRQFFTQFAQVAGFDPLQPEKWAAVTLQDVLAAQVTPFFLPNVPFIPL